MALGSFAGKTGKSSHFTEKRLFNSAAKSPGQGTSVSSLLKVIKGY
jgi:hypothetical protein